jgi:hypothetical protein
MSCRRHPVPKNPTLHEAHDCIGPHAPAQLLLQVSGLGQIKRGNSIGHELVVIDKNEEGSEILIKVTMMPSWSSKMRVSLGGTDDHEAIQVEKELQKTYLIMAFTH